MSLIAFQAYTIYIPKVIWSLTISLDNISFCITLQNQKWTKKTPLAHWIITLYDFRSYFGLWILCSARFFFLSFHSCFFYLSPRAVAAFYLIIFQEWSQRNAVNYLIAFNTHLTLILSSWLTFFRIFISSFVRVPAHQFVGATAHTKNERRKKIHNPNRHFLFLLNILSPEYTFAVRQQYTFDLVKQRTYEKNQRFFFFFSHMFNTWMLPFIRFLLRSFWLEFMVYGLSRLRSAQLEPFGLLISIVH